MSGSTRSGAPSRRAYSWPSASGRKRSRAPQSTSDRAGEAAELGRGDRRSSSTSTAVRPSGARSTPQEAVDGLAARATSGSRGQAGEHEPLEERACAPTSVRYRAARRVGRRAPSVRSPGPSRGACSTRSPQQRRARGTRRARSAPDGDLERDRAAEGVADEAGRPESLLLGAHGHRVGVRGEAVCHRQRVGAAVSGRSTASTRCRVASTGASATQFDAAPPSPCTSTTGCPCPATSYRTDLAPRDVARRSKPGKRRRHCLRHPESLSFRHGMHGAARAGDRRRCLHKRDPARRSRVTAGFVIF